MEKLWHVSRAAVGGGIHVRISSQEPGSIHISSRKLLTPVNILILLIVGIKELENKNEEHSNVIL